MYNKKNYLPPYGPLSGKSLNAILVRRNKYWILFEKFNFKNICKSYDILTN